MSKRISTRTIVPVAVVMAAFVTLCFILLYSYVRTLIQDNNIERVAYVAKTVVSSLSYEMLNNDHAAVEYSIANMGSNPGVVHLRVFDKKGVIRFSKNKAEVGKLVDLKAESCNICHNNQDVVYAGEGNERVRFFQSADKTKVLGLSYPVPRQDGCATNSCHDGQQQRELLGVVDVGMSQQQFQKDMAGVAKVLVGFWFMVVLLAVGIVAAILQKNVLVPIDRLYRYAKQLRRGIFVEPDLEDNYELKYIAETIKEFADKDESKR
ncbi:MAG: hypothetical protein B6I36_01200 [Desulfobacteraceae bacterium 4572_35.1]|nr:MAG: hypothetical protein B6I36_01200 [Desulfobacteraceae bacterium 4572_35.1]